MLKRRTTLIIISLFALLVPAAMAQAKPEIAIQDEDVFVDGKTLGPTQGYERLAELGVHRMRILVSADSVETGGGGFDFRRGQGPHRRDRPLRPGSPRHGAGQVPAQDGLRQQPVPPRQALPEAEGRRLRASPL